MATLLVPLLFVCVRFRPDSATGAVPALLTVSVPCTRVSPPLPAIVPPRQSSGPRKVNSEAPCRLPPLITALLRTCPIAVDDSVRLPPDRVSPSASRPCVAVRLPPETDSPLPAAIWTRFCTFNEPPDTARCPEDWMPSAAWSPEATVTVGRAVSRSISTTSAAVGRTPPDQLAAVDHRPLLSVSQNRTGAADLPICSTCCVRSGFEAVAVTLPVREGVPLTPCAAPTSTKVSASDGA